ncbi:hypothetical protein [Psychroserpens sp. NJDZ02]|uniref:hypothetical protein n=1 Tax=Psychroserpens sp. NJDZ02 TaxID=2570561 RepID=UPI0010A9045D|nr:hypothetical protein [Psychroserpens sp. NJDZ02]QCE41149.1 hypothetical protein E9099_06865 [Psychroserpens sp. NJDZ02]
MELSSNDFTINVLNEIPEFSYNNIFTEDFSSINSWVLDSYSKEQFREDNPLVGYIYQGNSEGGGITINNSLAIETGSYLYRTASKNIDNLNITETDNLKVSIQLQGELFTSRLHFFDGEQDIGDFIVQINDYKISFKDYSSVWWCDYLEGQKREFFLNRYNLSNRDLDFYIYYNGSSVPELKIISDHINITERFKIEYNPSTVNSITFQVHSDTSDYSGGGVLEPENRALNLTKLEISKFNLN